MIITRSPLRISLVGGGTDMASFYENHPGAVVSFAIKKYVYVAINRRFDENFRVSYSKIENHAEIEFIDHDIVRGSLQAFKIKGGWEISIISDLPGNGTGLGSSSALTVGLVNALGRDVRPALAAERAYLIERTCGHPVGKQDQYASALGGINYLEFHKKHVRVTPILPGPEFLKTFESHCLLLYTGRARSGNEILANQQKSFQFGGNVEIGKDLSTLATDFFVELVDKNRIEMKRIGEFLHSGWQIKKLFANGITNPAVDTLYEKAMNAGAYGGKLLGAGGGGFLFFIAPPYLHGKIEEVTGLRRLNFKIEMEGSKVIYDD